MLVELHGGNLGELRNPAFRDYASVYARIADDFLAQVRRLGLEIDPVDYTAQVAAATERLRGRAAVVRNDRKSVYVNRFSPACDACRTGDRSASFFVSLQCHRDCFYCFNPNQVEYRQFAARARDVVAELRDSSARQVPLTHIALTGGEPLLFKRQAVEFFRVATELYPGAYKRLYTCGDQFDAAVASSLRDAGLHEVRFSIRMFDTERARRRTLDAIELARRHITNVMVEMPVLPGTAEQMQALLRDLDSVGVASINLLELCFPAANAQAFRDRGYLIKNRPLRVLYNYQYAGGLPVSRSELECLSLLEFALAERLKIGVHYCSLENKHTSQVFRQNCRGGVPAIGTVSARDFFIKTAKVFGHDRAPVKTVLERNGYWGARGSTEHDFLEFHVDRISLLRGLDVEIGISWNVIEERVGMSSLRELRVDRTSPELFDLAADI